MRAPQTSCRPQVIAAMPGTISDIAKRSGVGRTAVFRHIEALHSSNGCHIISWVVPAGGGRYGAVYAAGPGFDVEKPETVSKPIGGKSGKPRNRVASEITLNERRARKLGLANADRMAKTRDPLVAALFGAVV